MSIKQYTTPTIRMNLEGSEEILANASAVILTVSDGETDIDLEPEIDGAILTATMTEEQTAQLNIGNMFIEATVKIGSSVFKTKTLKTKLNEAVRDRVVE